MDKTYYTIYKITNKINGKTYIGKHKTKNLEDGYMGSGKYLNRAIEKNGKENFEKEIIFVFDTIQDMNAKEAELVNEDYLTEGNTYNLKLGGEGGFDYLNSDAFDNPVHSKEHFDMMFKKRKEKYSTEDWSNIQKGKNKGKPWNGVKAFLGKTHSEEWKQEHSKKMKGKIPWNKGLKKT